MAPQIACAPLDDKRIETLAEMCRMMGDPTRLTILLSCQNAPRSVGEIADRLGLSAALTSHHLRSLRAARLVSAERRGQRVYYQAADAHVRRFVQDMCDHVRETRTHD